MFELSIALKYLLPKKKQLSLSIISVISVFVISLVVWLVLVFLSVTNGMEKNWIEKLVAINGPVQITPKPAYFSSRYYLIDSISLSSDYQLKSIEQKLNAPSTNPYDPKTDLEVPEYWSPPLKDAKGEMLDLVKAAFKSLEALRDDYPSLKATTYETAYAAFNIKLIRTQKSLFPRQNFNTSSLLTQTGLVSSIDPSVSRISNNILPPDAKDIDNFLHSSLLSSDDSLDLSANSQQEETFRKKTEVFFSNFDLYSVKTPITGWILPYKRINYLNSCKAIVLKNHGEIEKIFLPTKVEEYNQLKADFKERQKSYIESQLSISKGKVTCIQNSDKLEIDISDSPIIILKGTRLKAKLDKSSIQTAKSATNILLNLSFTIQGQSINLQSPIGNLELDELQVKTHFKTPPSLESAPPWLYSYEQLDKTVQYKLPEELNGDEPIFLPKAFKDKGARLGDRGYISYQSSTSSSIQEQKIAFYIAGFFDPGLSPLGSRMALISKAIPQIINNDTGQEGTNRITGIRVDIPQLSKIPALEKELKRQFINNGLEDYWKVESFYHYEFSKDFIEQLQSDKTLLTLIAVIIIIVACSNIVSMLILLVNDKTVEIGILQSMGATSKSIAAIFGGCGIALGITGCVLGTSMAMLTLANFDVLVSFLSQIQGHNAFNAAFYGETIPTELSLDALYFVICTTVVLSLIAGIIPAIKATLIKPTETLRT